MKIYKISQTIKIHQDYYDYHDQQHDARLDATDDKNNILGTLWFSVHNDEPFVKFIEVKPAYRRQGIGTKLIKELQRLFPDKTIGLGMSTEEGSELIKSLNFTITPNPEYARLISRKRVLIQKLQEIKYYFDRLYESNVTIKPSKKNEEMTDVWNQVEDELHLIDIELINMHREKKLIAY